MRKFTVAALGVALTLGAGLAPATAAPNVPGGDDALVEALKNVPRNLDGARDRQKVAKTGAADALNQAAPEYFERLSGQTRYETAVAVSEMLVCGRDVPDPDCWGMGGTSYPVDTVFVASGANFPDALGAGPLASGLGPLLLVPASGTVPVAVAAEIQRIDPDHIVVMGGPGAVSTGIEAQLAAYGTTHRVAGADRYETAAMATLDNHGLWMEEDIDGDGAPDGHGLDTIVLTSGATFADALAGGGAAANSRGSLLLTAYGSLPPATLAALQEVDAPEVLILGGTTVVSTAVEAAVRAAVPSANVVRVAGPNRFATANLLSERVFEGGASDVLLVNAYNFPDALASAPLAGFWGASTLLSHVECVTADTAAEALRLDPIYVTAVGGDDVVSDNALHLGVC